MNGTRDTARRLARFVRGELLVPPMPWAKVTKMYPGAEQRITFVH